MDSAELRLALRTVADVLKRGDSTHPVGSASHWLNLDTQAHLRRALEHADKALVGVDDGEDHLGHALARMLLACEVRERQRDG
jgi:hypothetical protein